MMSDTTQRPAPLLETHGRAQQLDSAIACATATTDGQYFALGTLDGDILRIPVSLALASEAWATHSAHDAAVTCLQPDPEDPHATLSGGEDGRLIRLGKDASATTLFEGRKWIDHIATTSAHIAFSYGKVMELRDRTGRTTLKTLEHPSAVTGITFDGKGKRVAASHYNGASMWFVNSGSDTVRSLEWKGSHTGIAMHPKGEALVTAMQENDLHGWRLSDGHNMRMSGYSRKVTSLTFNRNGRWLATSGADALILWPFFGGGPMGKPPREIARMAGVFCTCVRAHPEHDVVAAGYEDGTLLLIDLGTEHILPIRYRSGPSDAITTITFTPRGGAMAFGTEAGEAGVVILNRQGAA